MELLTGEVQLAAGADALASRGAALVLVTLGPRGAYYRAAAGRGLLPACEVDTVDTTGAGDAFFSGTVIGLTYGKNIAEACEIGTRLAASVICTSENVCPRFLPEEFGLDVNISD